MSGDNEQDERPVTMDELMTRLGQFEQMRENRDFLRKEVDKLRNQNATLLKSPALGNVVIVTGVVNWCNDDHRIMLTQGWFEWLVIGVDLVVKLDDIVRVVGNIDQQPEDDPDYGISRRFRVKALSAEIVAPAVSGDARVGEG